jgi:hypothetical protein
MFAVVVDQEFARLIDERETGRVGDGERIDGARGHQMRDADRAARLARALRACGRHAEKAARR